MVRRVFVHHLSKKFFYWRRPGSFLEWLLDLFHRPLTPPLLALDSVSFHINHGEVVGIIGKNGGGKSTLLKVIAGIYSPSSGNYSVRGSITYLSGFSRGIIDKLTARENIFLVGSLMGLSAKEIRLYLPSILDFSGLWAFLDTPVSKFSSGMRSRLSFSIALFCLRHRRPDVLLLDEVFSSGGDLNFQQKSLEQMSSLIGSGTAVLLASHNLSLVEEHCDRVLWLDKGRLVMDGPPSKVISAYKKDAS